MIIKALRHNVEVKLSLTKRALREPTSRGSIRMYVNLTDIKKSLNNGNFYVYGYWATKPIYEEADGMRLIFLPKRFRIGCCCFGSKEFRKIVAAAKKAK